MRLLFVSHSFPPPGQPLSNLGGMQRVATELHAALAAHPQVELSSLVLRSSWRWTHVRAVPFMAKALWSIERALAREAADVVLFSSMVTAALAAPLRKSFERSGTVAAAIVHGRDVTLDTLPYQRFLVPRVFAALDAVLPVSRATGQACLDRGLPPRKLHVLPNGIHVERFVTEEPYSAAERHSAIGPPLSADALLLCSVGRQVRRKGFAWFVEHVMPLLPPNVHYWLGGEGPESDRIREAATRGGVADRVRLLGRLSESDLERLYRRADLFVMPNIPVPGDMEGFGVVLLEAGLCGLPAVAARLEGILDVVEEGRNGHLVDSGDASAFAEVILGYERDRDTLRAASARAMDYVAAHFSWEAVANRYVQTLAGLSSFNSEHAL